MGLLQETPVLDVAVERFDSAVLNSLAQRYRLKTRYDDCGEKIIPGKYGHLYDPENPKQVKLVLRVAGVQQRRVLSDEQRMRLIQSTAASRFQPAADVQGVL